MHERTFQVELNNGDICIMTLYLPDETDDEKYVGSWIATYINDVNNWDWNED